MLRVAEHSVRGSYFSLTSSFVSDCDFWLQDWEIDHCSG